MKKIHKKAIGLVTDGKQQAFDVPEGSFQSTETKKKPPKSKPTYWRCVKNHIFEMKGHVQGYKIENLGCPVCGKGVLNQSNESTYLAYLDRTGRGDKMKYLDIKKKEKERRIVAKKLLHEE